MRPVLKAGAIGLAIVFVFMCCVYLLPGLASGLALLIYTGLVLVILNAFEVTLTLPGIAGIILGIGMAVDANVIIFALRVRMQRWSAAPIPSNTSVKEKPSLQTTSLIEWSTNPTAILRCHIDEPRYRTRVKGIASPNQANMVIIASTVYSPCFLQIEIEQAIMQNWLHQTITTTQHVPTRNIRSSSHRDFLSKNKRVS